MQNEIKFHTLNILFFDILTKRLLKHGVYNDKIIYPSYQSNNYYFIIKIIVVR